MKHSILKIFFVAILTFCLCGCIMGKEKKEELGKITSEAKKYIEDKYDKTFEIKDSGYILTDSTLFATYSDSIYVELTDGTRVLYSAEEDEFYDDYQVDYISKALIDKVWNPMLDKISPYKFQESNYDIIPNFNLFYEEGLKGNFFHEYYDGNIEKYLKNEKITVALGYFDKYDIWYNTDLYIISEEENSWKERFDIVDETFSTYFQSEGDDYSINLAAITSLLYEQEVLGKEYPHINIGLVGCFATGNSKNLKVQKYIKIANGIYVTSSENNFVLEESDITLKEVMSANELQNIINDAVKTNENLDDPYKNYENYKYTINSLTPVYEMEFSNRVTDRYKKYGKDARMSVYIKLDVNELNISSNNNLYNYPIRDNKANSLKNYVSSYGNSQNGKSEGIYVFKNFHKDYYWIGIETKKGIEK